MNLSDSDAAPNFSFTFFNLNGIAASLIVVANFALYQKPCKIQLKHSTYVIPLIKDIVSPFSTASIDIFEA
jgi:hypothetical protein